MAAHNPPVPPAEGLVDLFGGQEVPPVRVSTAEPVYGAAAANVSWPKMLAGHHLCTLCVRAIHAAKDGAAPLTAVARRKGPNEELLLCAPHAQDMRERDDKAEKERKAREAATKNGNFWRKPSGKRAHREHA